MTYIQKHNNKYYYHFSNHYPHEAVVRSNDDNTPAVEVASQLGMYPGQIYFWMRQYKYLSKKQFNSMNRIDYSAHESVEIRKLKREISDPK